MNPSSGPMNRETSVLVTMSTIAAMTDQLLIVDMIRDTSVEDPVVQDHSVHWVMLVIGESPADTLTDRPVLLVVDTTDGMTDATKEVLFGPMTVALSVDLTLLANETITMA